MRINIFNPLIVTHIFSVLIGLIVIISLYSILDPFIVILWSGLTLIGVISVLKGRFELLNPILRFILALMLVFFVIIINVEKNWQVVLAFVLVVLLGIKSLELKKQRDVFQITGLAVLGIGVASFLRFDLMLGIFLLLVLVFSIILMLWQHIVDSVDTKLFSEKKWFNLFVKFSFSTSFLICLFILPLSFFFFFLLPRSFTPLFKGQSGFNVTKTGFSSKMSPGQMSEIVLSEEVAFRVKIEPKPENPKNLYWLGATLWGTDGVDWVPANPDPPEFKPFSGKNPPTSNAIVSQTITLPAKDEPFLFSLWYPVRVDLLRGIQYFRDGTLKLNYPINIPIRYIVYSSERVNDTGITLNEKKSGLFIPKNLDDKVSELAMELKGDSVDPLEIARKIEIYLKKPPFKYSLKSPVGFESGQTLSDFLIKTKTGYCELYAASMTILLRMSGIPARVAVGYRGAEYNPIGEYWVVREKSSHAWVQAYIQGKGWMNFDPTPSGLLGDSQIIDPILRSLQENMEISDNRRIWDWLQWQWTNVIIDLTPEKQRVLWREAGARVGKVFQESDFRRWNFSVEKIKINFKDIMIFALFFMISFFIIYFFKRKGIVFFKFRNHENSLRRKAISRLIRTTPVKGKYFYPGREYVYLNWWKTNHPEKYEKICELYYLQRYGANPSGETDEELKKMLVR